MAAGEPGPAVDPAWAPPSGGVGRGSAAPETSHRRLERLPHDRVLGGVAAGLAEHLGLPVLWLRVAFAVLTVVGGSGVAFYGLLWVLVPLRPDADHQPGEPGARGRLRSAAGGARGRAQAVAILVAVVAALVVMGLSGMGPGGALLPLVLVAGGAALVWRQADEARRARAAEDAAPPAAGEPAARRRRRWRARRVLTALLGAGLLAAGLVGFLASRGELAEARQGLLATAVVVAGLALLVAPWGARVVADLRDERAARIRGQERAEIAAQLHDSVLQTLALIQKAADDPREVARLARSQERELRAWLYRPAAARATTFAACLEEAMAEVEEAHGVPVEVVVVGDCPYVEPLPAVTAAAREAAVNAARHSGAPRVAVYGEVEPASVAVFVRDRGRGFDLDAVPADRYGVRHSIVARLERVGGRATVRTAPGEGTEVRLEVARG